MPNRYTGNSDYKYGFNGMESDDEVNGSKGNSYTTQFRQYDSRIGRWLSLDPLMAKYPHQSAYAGFNNNPIYFADPTGLEGEPATHKMKKDETIWGVAKGILGKGATKKEIADLKNNMLKWNDLDSESAKKMDIGTIIYTSDPSEKSNNSTSNDNTPTDKPKDEQNKDGIVDDFDDILGKVDYVVAGTEAAANIMIKKGKFISSKTLNTYSLYNKNGKLWGNQHGSSKKFLNRATKISYLGKTILVLSVASDIYKAVDQGGEHASKLPAKLTATTLGLFSFGLGAGIYFIIDESDPVLTNSFHTGVLFRPFEKNAIHSKFMSPWTEDRCHGNGCFPENTLVASSRGLLLIQNLQIGDSVYSFSKDINEIELNIIVDKSENISDSLIEIITTTNSFVVTNNHKIRTERGWVYSHHIKKGDVIITMDNKEQVIEVVNQYRRDNKVFNIKVKKCNNFFVTDKKYNAHGK